MVCSPSVVARPQLYQSVQTARVLSAHDEVYQTMGYEIDFLAVERGEKSGDAIAFRIGNLFGPREQQFVGIVDGGYTEDGENSSSTSATTTTRTSSTWSCRRTPTMTTASGWSRSSI